MKKIILWLLMILIPIFIYGACFFILLDNAFGSNALPKEEIFKVVNNNQELLIQTLSDLNSPEYELCEELKSKGIKKIWVGNNDESHKAYIEFFCGGKGTDNYYGFYFVDDDIPIGWEGTIDELKKTSKGWRGENGEYYTERITENWFYYEMHY